ncbi:alpha ketoglutarate dependent dioxygenase ABH4 [Perkinsela sp. CCAP 1560/4]|nr:alpha ketoglutarate dependent dioxygenase ABH4 [Perkinsela sp. CCAP 1560/4]|eukprot:KNH07733.1 alpha ketoglutarate dependent dioxygenase ABH4 [Perkinsela sp. CCAP 1560/4]
MESDTCGCTRARGCLICKRKAPYEPTHIDSSDAGTVPGLYVLPDILTPAEEQLLVSYFDGSFNDLQGVDSDCFLNVDPQAVIRAAAAPAWVISQSGRRKQDYGPKVNFQKRKIKLGAECRPVPHFLRRLLHRVSTASFGAYTTDDALCETVQREMSSFHAIEMVALEYQPQRGSHIEPHFDDFWAWGPRIVGINLLADAEILFLRERHADTDEDRDRIVKVRVPARSAYIMSKESRYEWQHAIAASMIESRRISMTFREFSNEIMKEEPEITRQILELNDDQVGHFSLEKR